MHIGIDASRSVIAHRTGTEAYSLQITRALLCLASEDRFTLYFNQPPPAGLYPSLPSVRQRVIPFPRLWTHVRLSLEVCVAPPDVLFVPAHVVPLLRRCPSVVTIHDLGYLHYPQAHSRLRWWHLHLSTRWSARVARLILADSQTTKSDLVRYYRVDPERIKVVYLGCDEAFHPVEDERRLSAVRERLGLAERYFLYLGTLQPRKNVGRLLDAYALARQRYGLREQLVLAGQAGWRAESIERKIEELGLGDCVRRTGYVPESEVPALLSGATALVFPSLYEGFGLPALEAMACGTPVIASDASSLPEVVGEAGLLLDPYDVEAWASAMSDLSANPAKREALQAQGRLRARAFTWERCARETYAALAATARG